ncbi:MAG: hypothetical protein WAM60_21620, partial [Candidatus Promineifilaceae bacterium]
MAVGVGSGVSVGALVGVGGGVFVGAAVVAVGSITASVACEASVALFSTAVVGWKATYDVGVSAAASA